MAQYQILPLAQVTTTGTATFDPTNDSVYEGNETAIVAITGVSGRISYRKWNTIRNNHDN